MQIILDNLGKRFNREWIFRRVNDQFESGKTYAVTGPNGSGKSTLLQVIAGAATLSEGKIVYTSEAGVLKDEDVYNHISIAAPYLELPEEMSGKEMIEFHASFKKMKLSADELLRMSGLSASANKRIRSYSSGMKQRLKLALAFFTKAAVIFLDEPLTNLDEDGTALYNQWRKEYSAERIIFIGSNDPREYEGADAIISVSDYKA